MRWLGRHVTCAGAAATGRGCGNLAAGLIPATCAHRPTCPSPADAAPCVPPPPAQFAGLGHKPESWVKKHDIVSFFEAPNSSNRKVRLSLRGCRVRHCRAAKTRADTAPLLCRDELLAQLLQPLLLHIAITASPCSPQQACCLPTFAVQEWQKKWNGKRLRLKHPDTGDTMDVTVRGGSGTSQCSCLKLHSRTAGWIQRAKPRGGSTTSDHPPPHPRTLASLAMQVVDTCDDDDCEVRCCWLHMCELTMCLSAVPWARPPSACCAAVMHASAVLAPLPLAPRPSHPAGLPSSAPCRAAAPRMRARTAAT